MSAIAIPAEVLRFWPGLEGASVSRITAGLINDTFLLDCAGAQYVLQRLHRIFSAEVNRDIQAVSNRLSQRGLTTPSIVPANDGSLWCERDGRVWRLLSYVRGHTIHAITDKKLAFQAGRIAAEFHAAMGDFEYEYRSARGHVHDTPVHLQNLARALTEHGGHRLYPQVEPLAQRLLAAGDRYNEIDELPLRHCHGDLKISNVLFDDDGNAICLIDLDTVNRMTWPLEMGDALRSWCNPRTEDRPGADLDLAILDAAMAGYATTMPGWLTNAEKEALITGLARICLELSARFLADALNEQYFGWDNKNYRSRGDHNLARGKSMAALHNDVRDKRSAAGLIVRKRLIA